MPMQISTMAQIAGGTSSPTISLCQTLLKFLRRFKAGDWKIGMDGLTCCIRVRNLVQSCDAVRTSKADTLQES